MRFLYSLQLNNFSVTPQQIIDANRIISEYADRVRNEQELCQYLSPVFANSLEEQVQFKEIFDEFFTQKDTRVIEVGKIKKQVWKYVLLSILGAAAVTGFIYYFRPPDVRPEILFSAVSDQDSSATAIQDTSVQVSTNLALKDSLPGFTIKQHKIIWGDGTDSDTAISHIYRSEGSFTILALVDVSYQGKFFYTDTVASQDPLKICFDRPGLSIRSDRKDSVKIGEMIVLTAVFQGRYPDSIHWTNQDYTQEGNAETLSASFNTEGVQTFFCSAFYGNLNDPCNTEAKISFTVYDPQRKPAVLFGPSARGTTVENRNIACTPTGFILA